MSTVTTPSTNLLLSVSDSAQAPVFLGEQRAKALKVLGAAVADAKVVSVMQLFNKDPSLAFETLDVPSEGGVEQLEAPLACLRYGISGGYVFAVARGFPVDALLQNETTTLLQEALSLGGRNRSSEADVSLLLSMGANWKAMVNHEPLYAVVANAFPAKGGKFSPGVVGMLLDAKVDFAYSPEFKCPYSVLVACEGWKKPDTAAVLAKTMARFVKAGLDLDRPTGSPVQTPLLRAIGSKSVEALVALVRMGVRTSADVLNGRDLFAMMNANGMSDSLPLVQTALMESQISRAAAAHAASVPPAADSAPSEAQAPVTRRRRLGAV